MIDFHCHLDLYPDPKAVARACIERGLYMLSVTTTPTAWAGTLALAANARRIRTALGLHPQIAHQRQGELGLFETLVPEARYVGEVGLDGAPEYRRHWQQQVEVFGRILDMCQFSGGRVLSLHSRRAVTQVLDMLEARPGAGTPILHWFSGSNRELDRAVDLGCWFSVGPAMLRGEKGRELARRMPREHVLTESDGPFAKVNGRAAWPWEAGTAVDELASLWKEEAADVERRLLNNLATLGDRAARRSTEAEHTFGVEGPDA